MTIDSTMTNRDFCTFTVLLLILTFCHSQNINYQCNFDRNMTGDCQFTLISEGSNNLALSNGNFPSSNNPTQPLSDVTAVRSLTTPNNEPCNFPYTYTPGNWQMYFCRAYSNSNFTCLTASGLGQCSTGKFVAIAASGIGAYDQTYVTDVKQSSSAIQCLDFYYYIPGTSSNARMQVGWKADADTQQIIELTAHSENRWQNSRSNYTAPSSSSYQLTFRMMRDAVSFNHIFGLDEIKIYDQPCDSSMTTTTTESATTITELFEITTTSSPEMITSMSTTTTSILPGTTTIALTTTTSITTTVSTTPSLFESSVITQDVEETLSSNVPIITTTTSTYTTIEPLLQIFSCDFSTTLCFESGELVVTNGNEFTSVDIVNEPPRFPLSDVSSIIEPTDYNELCKLPYQPSIDNNTNITSSYIWFCYKNQCPTESQQLANCKSAENASINRTSISHHNEYTDSLKDANLIVITKQSINHDDIHHLQLNTNQSSVPIYLTIKNITENKNSSIYLLSLLVFDESNQSSWENLLFQQYLPVDHVNFTTFIVHNESNLLKCLPADYPCLDTSEMPDTTVSYQAISVPGTIITVINATIHCSSSNMLESSQSSFSNKDILKIYLSITTAVSCNHCQNETLKSINRKQIPFKISSQDNSSIIIITIKTPDIQIIHIPDQNLIETEETAIHWHGLIQRNTLHMDGVSGITQCAILPNQSFVYTYSTGDQSGTYWYHSHYAIQYGDGLKGVLIIKDQNDPWKNFYQDEEVLQITNWYHTPAYILLQSYLYSGTLDIIHDTGLINGIGQFNCTLNETCSYYRTSIRAGTIKRYRIINTSIYARITLTIDQYQMRLIEADGIYLDGNKYLRALRLSPGQQYSVIVTAKKKNFSLSYWIRVTIHPFIDYNKQYHLSIEPNIRAILQYINETDQNIQTIPSIDSFNDDTFIINQSINHEEIFSDQIRINSNE
ncbi:unnamed protein product [Rotaria sordida]|uniref:MAM domain-containing protein n=1 Tax=Rotaria sordida TaxID=392033 RepID=A0A815PFB6_9BILA|nr:unnamed protein product [Rotaria sordida]CAF1448015.1 unnamed protein product [Rotaria sordida]